MNYSKAPLRINFAGGGTDIEPYVQDYGGYILSAAVKLYARAIYRGPSFPRSAVESVLSEVGGANVQILCDVYPASGLGGSSTCLVAGLKAIFPELGRDEIARLAFYLERRVMKIPGGIQDQYCAAHGGFLFLTIEGQDVYMEKLELPEALARLLLLVYTGSRSAAGETIIEDQLTRYNVKALHHQKQIARAMKESLPNSDLIQFGNLLGEAWQAKCAFSALVTNSNVDGLLTYCLANGATAGCLMGAGGGGYLLLMEHPEKEGQLRQALIDKEISYVNVELDTEGVRVTKRLQ